MSGLGLDDFANEHQAKPDFERGSGGEPLITMPDGKRERFARCSSLGDTLDEKSGLTNWRIAKAIEGVAARPELVAKALAISPYEDHRSEWGKVREEAIQAGRGAYKADIGTAVHAMSERWEQEPDYDPGDPYRTALEVYSKELGALGLQSLFIEVNIVNDLLRVAGTADRLYVLTVPLVTPTGEILPTGTIVVGDLKTGSSLEYSLPGYAVQFSSYAGGTIYDVSTNERVETPEINQKWAILVHLSVETAHCEFLWVDLDVGMFGAQLANEVKEWRRNWRRKSGYKESVVPVITSDVEPEPEPVKNFREVADEHREAKRAIRSADDLEAWRSYCRERLDAVRAHEDAKRWMLARWPEGMQPPKRFETIDQARELSALLDRVEAEHGFTFPEGEPS